MQVRPNYNPAEILNPTVAKNGIGNAVLYPICGIKFCPISVLLIMSTCVSVCATSLICYTMLSSCVILSLSLFIHLFHVP